MIQVPMGLYPVAILQDRYNGALAGGQWIAIANAEDQPWRLKAVWEGAHGEEDAARLFWTENRRVPWLGVGATPDAALTALIDKMEG